MKYILLLTCSFLMFLYGLMWQNAQIECRMKEANWKQRCGQWTVLSNLLDGRRY